MRKSGFRKRIRERFESDTMDKMKKAGMLYIIAAAEEDGKELELETFLENNPDATVFDAGDFLDTLIPDMIFEIVDDSELDEED